MTESAENLPAAAYSTRPEEIKLRIVEIKREVNDHFMELGALILEVYRNDYHSQMGYGTFEAFVNTTLEMSYRKAKYLMDVVEIFIEQIDAPRELLSDVGYTKASALLPIVTKDNAQNLLQYAKENTTSEINKHVREIKSGGEQSVEAYTNLTFGLYDGERMIVQEALEIAARETGNDRPGYCLTRIMEDYLGEARARHEQNQPGVLSPEVKTENEDE